MSQESGFIIDIGSEEALHLFNGNLQDFRLLHEPHNGLMKVLTARKSGRIFIVKTIRDQYRDDPVAMAALRKEYEISMSVDSPCVAKAYDLLDVAPFGVSIIEEYCGPSSLEQMIDAGSIFSPGEAVSVISGIFRAIDDIHAAGVVHRDIKPSNIIYNANSASVKVIDFGCADADNYEILRGAAGTPRFMPPTLTSTAGSGLKNDFYAAGVTLELLLPIIPDRLKRAVRQTASGLKQGNLSSGREANDFFLKKCRQRRSNLMISASVLAAVLLAIAVFYSVTTKIPNSGANVTPGQTNMEMTNSVKAKTPSSVASTGTKSSADRQEMPHSHSAAVKADKANMSTQVSAARLPYASENEMLENEYGVTHAEAKYVASFDENVADKTVVDMTDKVLTELMIQYNESEPEDREAVLEKYRSLEHVSRQVTNELEKSGCKYDPTRTLGLVKERLKLWHHTYRLTQ